MTDLPNASEPVSFQAQIAWPDRAMSKPVLINASAVTQSAGNSDGTSDGSVYLLLGHVGFPIFADQAEARQYFESGKVLPVDLEGSFFLQRSKAHDLWVALGSQLGYIQPDPAFGPVP